MLTKNTALIEPKQLLDQLDDPDIVVLDGSMQKTVSGINENYGKKFIKGSYQLNFDNAFCDPSSHLPHTMLTAEKFTEEARKIGINNTNKIVVYDDKGVYSSPRIWWMFKSMGFEKIWVLNGGLPGWEELGYPVEKNCQTPLKKGDFSAKQKNGFFYSVDDVLNAIDDNGIQIIDVRSSSRFTGKAPEPRVGLRSGHIPSAINIPFKNVMSNSQYICFAELSRLFRQKISSKKQKLVFNCGSGVTSCVVALAAYHCGYTDLAVYDGSWAEWGARTDLPVETS